MTEPRDAAHSLSCIIKPNLHETLVACRFVGDNADWQLEIKAASHNTYSRLARGDPLAKRSWNRRPEPKEVFPLTAKVWRETRLTELHSGYELRQAFTAYEPIALGLHKNRRHVWICLRESEGLTEFVQRVDGSAVEGFEVLSCSVT